MKKLLLPALFFFASELFAQKIIKTEKVTDYSIHIIGNDFEGAIFSKAYKSEWLSFKRTGGKVYAVDNINDENTDILDRFTPTPDEVDYTETLLRSGLKQLNRKLPPVKFMRGPNVYRHLKYYKRQYFGFLTKNNQKVIMMNCFWGDEQKTDTDWLINYYNIFDGGNYYWTIKINLATHQLFDFGVNGALI